jgi:hypothetical protein
VYLWLLRKQFELSIQVTFQETLQESKMSASVLPAVFPLTFTTDNLPPAPPLVRSINESRWWGAVLYLDDNPDVFSVEASPARQEWTWRLERTPEKFVYIQNTYSNGKLMVSSKMDTSFSERNDFISQSFPSYKLKND